MKTAKMAALALAAVSLAALPGAASVFVRAPKAPRPAVPARSGAAVPGARPRPGAEAQWPFGDIPVPAGVEILFAMPECKDGFSMASGRSPQGAATAAASIRAALAAGGWVAAEPTAAFDGASFWMRGRFVAMASATAAAGGDGCVWLIARRPVP